MPYQLPLADALAPIYPDRAQFSVGWAKRSVPINIRYDGLACWLRAGGGRIFLSCRHHGKPMMGTPLRVFATSYGTSLSVRRKLL